MVKYNELSVSSNKNKTRVGRGISAGRGKTITKIGRASCRERV